METGLNNEIEETMNQQGVVGVICTDSQGLCLGAEGTASPHSAGVIAALALQAMQLSPEQSSAPVVCLESDKGNVLIKSHNDITVAVHKMPVY
ncbi:ragulator complex protein LAMTOR5-like [Apostichopus japonicus]|uniref:ragulator complex protein LAMTOR5-like n=1 Tax=Stichopus japonicus TaxID=307972 RepID=UPI003AB74696